VNQGGPWLMLPDAIRVAKATSDAGAEVRVRRLVLGYPTVEGFGHIVELTTEQWSTIMDREEAYQTVKAFIETQRQDAEQRARRAPGLNATQLRRKLQECDRAMNALGALRAATIMPQIALFPEEK
jgi:hypothetical protein